MLKEWKGFFQKLKGLAAPGRNLGFSLMELMVVVAIIAILALGVFGISRNPISDVKGAVFNMRSDLAYGRAEAAKRNEFVLVEFIWGAAVGDSDGYRICVDDGDNTCGTGTDIEIKTVNIDPVVQFYVQGDLPGGGGGLNSPPYPDEAVSGIANVWPDPGTTFDFDGVTFPEESPTVNNQRNFINLLPDGSSDAAGAIYLYAPDPEDTASKLRTPPLGLSISMSGVMQIRRWDGSAWTSK